ncbi:MAG: biotin--[Thermoguttaceae bacterium]|nr:biotin--[acetyl-CoA-carboxylase] ligase [Thermoguttaceae bacterium]
MDTMQNIRRIHFSTLDSTHSWTLRELEKDGFLTPGPFPALVTAETQTHGRGQHSRSWFSPAGCLMLSLVFRPEEWKIPFSQRPLLGIACALAVLESCAKVLSPANAAALALHWPNDIYVQKDSASPQKLAGILLEGHPSGVMSAGIGINLQNSSENLPEELRERLISLSILEPEWIRAPALRSRKLIQIHSPKELPDSKKTGASEPMERFLSLLCEEISKQFSNLAHDASSIILQADRRCAQKGQKVTFQSPNGELQAGFCTGLNSDGALLINGKPHYSGMLHF